MYTQNLNPTGWLTMSALLASLPLLAVWIGLGSAITASGIVAALLVGSASAVIGLSSAWRIFATRSITLPLEGVK